jgi:glycosyltransferase involved in cell wall biosynthesis
MLKPTKTICLNMIVKNERHVIERCLASVKSVISYWVIVDTGSSDGTQDAIRDYLHDIPGELIERPWIDFAHNRSEALAYARGKADYLLFIDADEVFVFAEEFEWPELDRDGYRIETLFGGLSYHRLQLVRNVSDWYYNGVLHECITSAYPKDVVVLKDVINLPSRDGARSTDPHKFKRDALTLESALLSEPSNSRYVFYLAQSYHSAGEYDNALKHYRRRIQMAGGAEEVWYSRYQAAMMQALLGEPWEKVLPALLEAYAHNPDRAEPLYHIAVHYREEQNFPLAHLFIQRARSVPGPGDAIFVEKNVYDYLIDFEYAICCYWSGQHAEAIRVNNQLLGTRGVAPEIFDRALKNRRFSLDALYPKKDVAASRINRFKILVSFGNAGHSFDNCIASLLEQDYENFELIFLDNASTDGSCERVPAEDARVRLIRSEDELTRPQFMQTAIRQFCEPDDIVVSMDGADWLANRQVLSKVNELYNLYDCWVLYGQYGEANGRYGTAQPYPDETALHELGRCRFPHLLQTFRARLYLEVHAQGLDGFRNDERCVKLARSAAGETRQTYPDEEGGIRMLGAPVRPRFAGSREPGVSSRDELWRSDDDVLMVPLLRRAGFEKVRFNDEVLYILNTDRTHAKRCNHSRSLVLSGV